MVSLPQLGHKKITVPSIFVISVPQDVHTCFSISCVSLSFFKKVLFNVKYFNKKCFLLDMKFKNTLWIMLFLVSFTLFVSGCTSNEENVNRILIQSFSDDGGASILKSALPNKFGSLSPNMEWVIVGNMLGGENELLTRGLYRFNLSNWTGEDLVLKILCLGKTGNPGVVDIYIISDDWDLGSSQSEMMDVSSVWDLLSSGTKLASVSPSSLQWIEVEIPNSTLQGKQRLSLMLKLANEESIGVNNYYQFSTYDYWSSHGNSMPYLEPKSE